MLISTVPTSSLETVLAEHAIALRGKLILSLFTKISVMALLPAVEAGDMEFGVLTDRVVLLNFFNFLPRNMGFLAVSRLMITPSTPVTS